MIKIIFHQGFYYLYKNASDKIKTMQTYPEALMISFQMTLGEFKVINLIHKI